MSREGNGSARVTEGLGAQKKRVVALLLLCATVVVGVWQLSIRNRGIEGGQQGMPGEHLASEALAPRSVPMFVPAPEEQTIRDGTEQVSMIDRVELSKSDPCVGEPVLVTVRTAASVSKRSLTVLVDGKAGNPGTVRFDSEGPREIPVYAIRREASAAADRGMDRRKVAVNVRECVPGFQSIAIAIQKLRARETHSLVASIPNLSADRVKAITSWEWDFGDGRREQSAVPYLEHNFDTPDAEELMTTFIVRVRARFEGRLVEGEQSLALENLYVLNRLHGQIVPRVMVGETTSDSMFHSATIQVTHFEDEDLRLTHASLSFVPCTEGGQRDPSVQIAPAELIGTDILVKGKQSLHLRVPAARVPPSSCVAQVALLGESRAGNPVRVDAHLITGEFAPQKTLALGSQGLSKEDGERMQSVRKAIQVLGRANDPRPSVTEEEMDMLRRQGRL